MKQIEWLCVLSLATAACANASAERSVDDSVRLPREFARAGLRYVPLHENHSEAFEIKAAAPEAEARVLDFAAMSDEEYATHLVGFTEFDGFVYRVEPELEHVRALRSEPARDIAPGLPQGETLDADSPDTLTARYIIDDGQNWSVRRDNTSFPMRTIVQLDNSVGGCSGVMIGLSTLLSASHCFFDGTNFRDPFIFRPGADIGDANPYPWGEFGCYSVVVAGGGVDGNIETDYAVVDFRSPQYGCNDRPGSATGYMGTKTQSDSILKSVVAYLYGYPTMVDPYPQIYGMSGRISKTTAGYLGYNMDEVKGHSGSPVYYYELGTTAPFVAAINSGGNSDFGIFQNRGARFTSGMWNSIRAWSQEY